MTDLKVAVIVPHQDDELNIAGQVLPFFTKSGFQVKILFSTNGDARVYEGDMRYRETVAASAVMGVTEENLVWLGYPDCKSSAHLYHDRFEDIEHSERMFTKCYGPVGTLAELMTGAERPVCRASMLADIELFLASWLPDVIFAIDYDSHPDHRALSLLFDEALSRVVLAEPSYKPFVLKKFAYAGCWYGPDDYYSFAETKNVGDGCKGDVTGNPYLHWGDRVCFAPHPSSLTPKLRDNVVYMAARAYKSQIPWPNIARVCNGDVVYWLMRTDNLLFGAEVSASSGDVTGLFDFRRFDVKDISEHASGDNLFDVGWRADGDDLEPMISVSFAHEVEIRIVEVIASVSNSGSITVEVLVGNEVVGVAIADPGRAGRMLLDVGVFCKELTLRIRDYGKGLPGIVEVGVYGSGDCEVPGLVRTNPDLFVNGCRENFACRMIRKGYFWMLKKGKRIRRRLSFERG